MRLNSTRKKRRSQDEKVKEWRKSVNFEIERKLKLSQRTRRDRIEQRKEQLSKKLDFKEKKHLVKLEEIRKKEVNRDFDFRKKI